MKILIDDAVFMDSQAALRISHLVMMGGKARFRPIPEKLDGEGTRSWLAKFLPDHSADYQLIFDCAVDLESREPSAVSVTVCATNRSIWSPHPRITLDDALILVQRPFSIVVENRISDRAFVLAMAPQEVRKMLLRLEEEGTLQFENGGGITVMHQTLAADLPSNPDIATRKFFLFDGDAQEPGAPSRQSEQLRHLCEVNSVPFYQLQRRAIENYIPSNAIRKWVCQNGKRRVAKMKTAKAFVSMNPTQRAHFHLKDGFSKEHSEALYSDVSDSEKASLRNGFGKSITSIYIHESLEESDIARSGAALELTAPFGKIISTIC